jgi:thiol-disulfide isomerase/thioredoxin
MITKIISTLCLIALFLLSNVAVRAQKTSGDASSDQNTINAKVYAITGVLPAEKGKATDFTWKDGDKTIKFSEFTKNKVVFLNFWGTWCGPCKREIPDIIQICKDLTDKDFVIISIATEGPNLSFDQAKSRVKKFAEDKGIPYMIFISNKEIQESYGGIPSIPTTKIIDKGGNVIETIIGMRDKETFMQSISRVLK